MHYASWLFVLCFLPQLNMVSFAYGAEKVAEITHYSGIISEERTVRHGQAQKLLSVPNTSLHDKGGLALEKVSPQDESSPASPVSPASPISPTRPLSEGIQSSSTAQQARVGMVPKRTENLLDSMDVYALSPHAKNLILPRMIPPTAVQQWYASHAQEIWSQEHREQRPLGLTMPEWENIIQHASKVSGLDAALIAAVIAVESDFDAYAVSSKGAQGAMQIMPETQMELGLEDAFDPFTSVEAGSRYLRKQLDRFGKIDLALAAYNAGAGNVLRYGGIPPFKETQDYVRKVMGRLSQSIP